MKRIVKEKIEDSKLVIRSRKSNDRQYNGQKEKGQTIIYQTLHRKLKNEQCKPHLKVGVNSDKG